MGNHCSPYLQYKEYCSDVSHSPYFTHKSKTAFLVS